MEKPKILSGQVIVAKGITKIDVTLPEVGLKDIIPNGSWLEQKQVQAALEARKHLIEVERIEKHGTLSHAIWRDDLQLAEVTQKAGGYWQYFGHNVGKTLYLRPEEALFLMEVNCLLLKHNDITVSFQKAYSLILNDTASFEKYKVYASLSRLGYKVFKHKVPKINKEKNFDHNTSEDIEKLVDTKDVENILKQPLSNSNSASVEILDSDKLPITEPNNSAIGKDEDSKTTKKESIEGSEQCDNSNVIRKSPCVMEVEENEIKFSSILESFDSDKLTLNVNNVVTESNAGVNHSVSMQSNEAELHNSESENNENKTNEIKDIEGEKVMEIDDSALVESELALDGSSKVEIRVEQQQNETIDPSSSIISSIVEQKNNITEIVTPTNVKAHPEDSNVDSTDNAHNETHDKPIAMDTCYECSQAVADSTVESEDCNEGNNTTLAIDIDSTGSDIVMDLDTPKSVEFISENRKTETSSTKRDLSLSDQLTNKRNEIFQNYVTKLKKLTSRQYKPSDYKTVYRHFENIPILYRKEVISINVPEQQYIPQNIFVNNSSYVLNLREIKNRSIRSASTDSTAYNSSDEVSGNHVRRLRSISNTEITQNTRFGNNLRFPPRQNLYFRPHTMWRPQNNLNYVQFNMFFQRPCYPNMYFQSRYQYPPRPNPVLRSFSIPNNSNPNNSTENVNNNIRKRIRSLRANHLQSIKNLAFRLKQFVMGGNHHIHNVESLHRLLFAFNTRYKARLRLTRDFEVINDETIVETIDLEEDDESKSKKRRLSQDNDKFNENLNLLRQLASKLKDLESKGKITSQHKRALSKAIKTFNKSYDADIYMNANFQVIDKRHINIASDSDTECVVEEPQKKRKRLRNPFNILKRRSEKEAEGKPSTSKENQDDTNNINNMVFSEDSSCNPPISKIFNENWMPNENDFGRPEVVKKSTMNTRFMDVIKEEYLLNFIKSHYEEFNNWLEVKIAFLQHMEETDIEFQTVHEKQSLTNTGIKPLIDPEDCLDSTSVLEKLRIIENNKGTSTATTLCIDFDVYNRDVPNFKKTNPPKPHFRIICMGESSSFPSSDDLIALHSKYDDNVSIVFAIVGINSVSYLQINPMDLPIYVASNDSD